MNSSFSLNSGGQAFLGFVGSAVMNTVTHPLCTFKNRLMANKPPFPVSERRIVCLKALYRGYTDICLTDSASLVMTYVVNGFLRKNDFSPLISSALAGVAASPVIAVGEAFMVNHQVHLNSSSCNLKMLQNAFRGAGLFATILREVPFTVALFSFAPKIETWMTFSNQLTSSTFSGLISGSICGAITAPADRIKTLIQAKNFSFGQAAKAVGRDLRTNSGQKRLLLDASTRALYMGLGVAILNVINYRLPHYLPDIMKE
ncbi:MAG: hypothetical protein H0W50_11060 [Parachlamydiaceae bacterium]|nr:hypothetical protein [Parachlamydiaceae bacterium]